MTGGPDAARMPWSVDVRIAPWPSAAVVLDAVVADTPVGEVVVLVAREPRALAALAMVRGTREAALDGLVADLAGHADVRATVTDEVRAALDRPTRPLADGLAELADPATGAVTVLVAGTAFARTVMAKLVAVPEGEVVTYGELAERAGRPRAARAVGTVMARTLVPLVVPCHRVVPASGGVGAYGPHPHLKRTLLELEGALARVAA